MKKQNRKTRKRMAFALMEYLEIDKIPNARPKTIEELRKQAEEKSLYEYEYNKYANW